MLHIFDHQEISIYILALFVRESNNREVNIDVLFCKFTSIVLDSDTRMVALAMF